MNIWVVLQHIADARNRYIEDIKNSAKLYNETVICDAVDCEIDLPIMRPDLDGLRVARLPATIMGMIDQDQLLTEVDRFGDSYKYVKIDGIIFRSEW